MAAQVSLMAGTASAAPAANIDQCANGGVGDTPESCAGNNWVNGNVNGQKAHWREGDFISYRAVVTDLAAGTHTLDFHWDTVHSSKHALDYIGSFDATETTSPTPTQFNANANDPCGDVLSSGCTPSSPQKTAPIGAATLVNCGGSAGTFTGSQVAGAIKLFGNALTGTATFGYLAQNVSQGGGECSSSGRVTFSTIGDHQDVVIAWGGHIASQQDWGIGNSASSISGSPYHMALDFLDGASTGSQDRALSTSAIVFTPSIATALVPSGQVNAGTSVHDTATLTLASGNAGGSVFYRYYTSVADCNLDAAAFDGTSNSLTHGTAAGTGTVTNGVVGDSSSVPFNSAGTFYWAAFYSGDNNNIPAHSDCTSEPLHVIGSPTLTTLASTGVLGANLTDTATLSGATAGAGGTISFYLFAPGVACSEQDQSAAVYSHTGIPVNGNGTYNSTSASGTESGSNVATTTGTYHWLAIYSGDANNNGTNSGCVSEPVVIGPVSPTLTTQTNESTGSIGDTLTDQATLTNGFNPTGTISFYLFAPGVACTTVNPGAAAVYSHTGIPVNGNGTYNSTSPSGTVTGSNTATTAGTYNWLAVYSGDGNNNGADSGCGTEQVVIGKNSPGLTTQTNESTGSIGDTLTDQATLAGATANAGGTISFYLFAPGVACTTVNPANTAVYTHTGIPVSGNGTYNSTSGSGTVTGSNTATTAGTYNWLAIYSGDGNNNGADSGCGTEQVVIGKNSPGLTTQTNESAGSIGDTLTDQASLAGATANAGGTISFYLFAPGVACTTVNPGATAVYSSTNVAVSGNGTYNSTAGTESGSNTATTAGTYHWLAVYSGDANNNGTNSGCESEPVVIAKNSPGLTTQTNESSGSIGDTLTDQATLSGATANAGGHIDFYLFAPGVACTTVNPGATAVYSSTNVAVSGNGTYNSTAGTESGDNTATVAGTYHWLAVYSGDNNNTGTNSGCGTEPVVVGPNTPGLTTQTNESSGSLGDILTDSATLAGGFNPTGTISFYLFAPGVTCSTSDQSGAVYRSTGVTVNGNGTYQSSSGTESGDNTATMAGTYHWLAIYSGDNNNTGTNSGCESEPVVIAQNTPSLPTQTSPSSGVIGDTLTDSATLSGGFNPTGAISFYLFEPGVPCDTGEGLGAAVYRHTGIPVNGNGTYSSTSASGTVTGSNIATMAGTYQWLAIYSGDANNTGANSGCGSEPVVIAPNGPKLTTNTTPDSGKIGVTLKDSASLTGATSDAGGTIDFYLFAPGVSCTASGSGAVYKSKGVPVNGNGVYHSIDGTESGNNAATKSGTYHWLAVYSGDSNNNGVHSGCGTEPVRIVAPPPAPPPVINPPVPVTG
jgi:hypothetical protein